MTESKPNPKPYVAREVQIIGAGTVIWVTVGLILALSGATSDRLWTCAVGVLLGLNGLRIALKRKKRMDSEKSSL